MSKENGTAPPPGDSQPLRFHPDAFRLAFTPEQSMDPAVHVAAINRLLAGWQASGGCQMTRDEFERAWKTSD